jgi:SHS2 domain-containing protein
MALVILKMQYKFLPHTADIKFQAFGKSLEESFANSAYALTKIMCKQKIKGKIKKTIKIKARNRERLLYDFLEEFLYLFEVGGFLLSKIEKIEIKGVSGKYDSKREIRYRELELKAEIYLDENNNYELENHVKAITYNDMRIESPPKDGSNKFVCQVVVDV